MRGVARPDPLHIGLTPRGPWHRVGRQIGLDYIGARRGHTSPPLFHHREPDIVRAHNERPLRGGAATLGHRRLLLKRDPLLAHLGGRRVEIRHDKPNVIECATSGRRRSALAVVRREHPHVPEA